jgi:hypothetical protein
VGNRDFDRDGRLQAKIYPNPSSDRVQVSGAQSLVGYNYSVMDLQGKVLLSGSFDEDEAISTRTLKNGTYFLVVSGSLKGSANGSANSGSANGGGNGGANSVGNSVANKPVRLTAKILVQH